MSDWFLYATMVVSVTGFLIGGFVLGRAFHRVHQGLGGIDKTVADTVSGTVLMGICSYVFYVAFGILAA